MTLSALETSLSKQSQHPILVTKANIWCATVMAKGLVEPPIVTNRMYAVADPGFPVLGGGGGRRAIGGVPTSDMGAFRQKCM